MIRTEFDKEKLQKYIDLLKGIVNISIAVFDTQFIPIVETDSVNDPDLRIENIKKKLPDGKKTSAIWLSSDETAEIATPVYHGQTLFAYVWIGDLFFEANANPHNDLMRENRPVYDRRTIRDIMEMIEFGVNLFLRDLYEIDPELHNKIDDYISANLDKKITYRVLSGALNVEIKILRAFFNDELKSSLPDYLRQRRIEVAKAMLSDSDLSITSISEQIGLNEEKFNQLFQRAMSVSPDRYRATMRK